MTAPEHEEQTFVAGTSACNPSVDETTAPGINTGWYDTLANSSTATKPPIGPVPESQPAHYEAEHTANQQVEAQYDIISSPELLCLV